MSVILGGVVTGIYPAEVAASSAWRIAVASL
jgi:hypothetical protein